MIREDAPEGFEALSNVLQDALEQSAFGKGRERHGHGRPFMDQPIITLGRDTFPGGTSYQTQKKMGEATKMILRGEYEAADREILGVMVYAAATLILLREKMKLCIDEGCDHHGTDHVCITREPPPAPPTDRAADGSPIPTTPVAIPIPTGVYWSTNDLDFRKKDTGHYMGAAFYDKWYFRREEFPHDKDLFPPHGVPSLETLNGTAEVIRIPEGIYWNETNIHFVDRDGVNQGFDFFHKWRNRRYEFPSWETHQENQRG